MKREDWRASATLLVSHSPIALGSPRWTIGTPARRTQFPKIGDPLSHSPYVLAYAVLTCFGSVEEAGRANLVKGNWSAAGQQNAVSRFPVRVVCLCRCHPNLERDQGRGTTRRPRSRRSLLFSEAGREVCWRSRPRLVGGAVVVELALPPPRSFRGC